MTSAANLSYYLFTSYEDDNFPLFLGPLNHLRFEACLAFLHRTFGQSACCCRMFKETVEPNFRPRGFCANRPRMDFGVTP
jgi:hypothetical protein